MSKPVTAFKKPPTRHAEQHTVDDSSDKVQQLVSTADVTRRPTGAPRKTHERTEKARQLDFFALEDDRRISPVNVRLTDREKGALDNIAANTPYSKHAFCVEAVRQALDAKLREMYGKGLDGK